MGYGDSPSKSSCFGHLFMRTCTNPFLSHRYRSLALLIIIFLLVATYHDVLGIYGIRYVKGLFLLVKFPFSFSCSHAT
jgi:hypothetical protein